MLVNYYTNDTGLPVGASNFRNRFQSSLDQLGMPNNLRKIALINGSLYGRLNGVSSGKYLTTTTRFPFLSFDFFYADFFHTTNKKSGSDRSVFYGRKSLEL